MTVDERIESGRAIEALRRKNLEGKKSFIEELRRQQDPKSISLLLEILCDESWYLRELALKSLVDMGEPARMPLRGILSSGLWYTRAAAVRGLGSMGDGVSAPHILTMLEDANRTARDAAVVALRSLVSAGQTAALGRALAAVPPERRGATLALIERIDPDLARHVEAAAAGAPPPPPPTTVADAPSKRPPPPTTVADAPSKAPPAPIADAPSSPPPPASAEAPSARRSSDSRPPLLSLFEIVHPATAEPPGGQERVTPPPTEGLHGEGGKPPGRA